MFDKLRGLQRAILAPALACMTVWCAFDSVAQTAEPTAKRPKICLVLSGGGARGAAHVGVIKVLEELRIPIDCIAGTSMGALVGAAYASGNTVAELEQLVASLSTDSLFNEKLPRREQSMRRKQDDWLNLIGPDFGFRDLAFQLPKGLVSGVQLERVIRRLARMPDVHDFDLLPIPFRAVATDLVTGKPLVFAKGELTDAMRASMSVPGAIAPVEKDGMILVDGGLTNNLPVNVAREMGADIIIAVNLGTPLLKREGLGSVLGVTAQMMNILTEQNVQSSLATLKSTDILIEPALGDFSAADFSQLTKAVRIGEESARKAAERLASLSLSTAASTERWNRQRGDRIVTPRPIDEIRFNGLRVVNPRFAESLLETKPGQVIDTEILDRDVQRLFGTGDFEHVGYHLHDEDGKRILVVNAIEKSWGPDYVRFGLGLRSDFRGDAQFDLLVRYRKTWLNALGAEWRSELQTGRTGRIYTEFYQPLDVTQAAFVAPYAEYQRRSVDLFAGNQRVARYLVYANFVGADVGSRISRYAEARLGLLTGHARVALDTGPNSLAPPEFGVSQGGVRGRLFVDQIDSTNFPREGYGGSATYFAARRALSADNAYNRWETEGSYVQSFGEHTFNFGYKFGGKAGTAPLPTYDLFQWGGFLQQSGFRTGALLGQSIAFGRLLYYNKLTRHTFLEGMYAGFSLEAGRVREPVVPGSPDGLLKSGAVLLGLDTPVGPLYVAYGRTTEGLYSYYLFLGKP
jgi:NTE family protein